MSSLRDDDTGTSLKKVQTQRPPAWQARVELLTGSSVNCRIPRGAIAARTIIHFVSAGAAVRENRLAAREIKRHRW